MPTPRPLGSGRRDRQVTIQQQPQPDAKAPSHYPVEAPWTTLAVVKAAKEELRGSERFVFSADQHSAPYDTRWELPYMPEMDPNLVNVMKLRRIVYEGRIHDIVAASEIARRRGIEVMTLAGGLLQ